MWSLKNSNSNSVYFAWYIFRASTWIPSWGRVTERWIHLLLLWKNNIFIAREIKRLQLHAIDKNLTSLPRRNQWSQKQCCHSFEGPEYLRLLITDLNSFEFPSLIWPNFKAYALARYFQEVRRGKELSDFMRLSIVLDPAIIACSLKRKSRSSLLIMISCSTLANYSSIYWNSKLFKTMERPKSNIKTRCLILVY